MRKILVARRRETTAAPEEQLQKHEPMTPGLHVAPFLDVDGRIVILVIDRDGRLAAQWAVTEIDGTYSCWLWPEVNPPEDDVPTYKYDDTDRARDVRLFERFGHKAWGFGIHLAPWKPRIFEKGAAIIMVDRYSCTFAVFETTDTSARAIGAAFKEARSVMNDMLTGNIGEYADLPYDYAAKEEASEKVS